MANFTAGTSFTDGVTNDVTAAKLNALVADAVPTANLSLNSTTGTIANFTASTANVTTGTITTLTNGTTTATAGVITSGTIGTLNSTTGTIGNLSTTLAGDLTISQGTATLATSGVTASSYGTTSDIPRITVDAKGRVTSATTVTAPVGFRNRIINGDMRIDQRNAGASVVVDGTAKYITDRFNVTENTDVGVLTAQQSTTAPVDFTNSLLVTTTTADSSLSASDNSYIYHAVEGYNISDFNWGTSSAKAVTLSFWVRSSLTGTFGGSLYNDDNNRSYPFTYSILSANTWEKKSITVNGDTSGTWKTNNSAGIKISFNLGTGSLYSGTAGSWANGLYVSATGAVSVVGTLNATFYITGVQLEAGSTATDFERRPYGTELALCQRYYQILDHLSLSAGRTTTSIETSIMFPVWMRTAPSIDSSVGQGYQVYDAFGGGFSQSSFNALFAVNGATQKGAFISLGNFTGLTQGRTYVTNAASAGKLGLSAEL